MNTVELGRWAEPQWSARAKLLRAKDPKPSLLLVGDSSLGYGVRPDLLGPPAFALSRPGLNCRELDQMSDRIDGLCQPRPRMIVVGLIWFEFLPFTPEFAFLQGERPKPFELAQGFYASPNLVQTNLFPGSRVARYWVDYHVDNLGEARRMIGIVIAPDGFGVNTGPDEGAHPKTPPQMADTQAGWFSPASLDPLKRFQARWEAAGVPVVFVAMPLHPAFRTQLVAKAGEDQRRLRGELKRAFGSRFFDFEEAVQDPAQFRDATHLNARGAQAFTPRLRDALTKAGLLPLP